MISISPSLSRCVDLLGVGREAGGAAECDFQTSASSVAGSFFKQLIAIFLVRYHLYRYDFMSGKIAKCGCSIKRVPWELGNTNPK